MKKKKICIYPPFKDILSKKIYPFPNQNIAKKECVKFFRNKFKYEL